MGYKKLGKDIALMTIGNFASKLLVFLMIPLYTSYLTTEDYGAADLITTTCSLLFPFFTVIIGEAMMRFALDEHKNSEDIYKIGVQIWTIGTVVFLCLSPIFLLFNNFRLLYIYLLLFYTSYSFQNTLSYYVRGINKVKEYAIGGFINTFFLVAFNILFLVVFKIGLAGYLISQILSNFIMCIWWIFAGKLYRINLFTPINKELRKKMLNYSIPMVPNSISWWVSNSSDKYILVYYVGTAINGLYSVAYKIPNIISIISNIFMSAWRLSSVQDFGTEKSNNFWNDVLSKFIALIICTVSCLLCFNKIIASLLYKEEFYSAWMFVPTLLIASACKCLSDFFGTIYLSAMKTKMLFYLTGIAALSNIVLNFILIPKYSAMGAAIATFASYAIILVIRIVNSKSIVKLKIITWKRIFGLILLFVQAIYSSGIHQYELWMGILISCIIFCLFIKEFIDVISKAFNALLKRRKNV